MALFTVFTGAIILISTILSGKRERVAESVLLRTIGASRGQILKIILTEYFFLGSLAAFTGGILAFAAAWALAKFAFKIEFLAHLSPLVVAVCLVMLMTIAMGMLLSRGVTTHPPLAILRRS